MNLHALRWLIIALVADVALVTAYLIVAVSYHVRRWLKRNGN